LGGQARATATKKQTAKDRKTGLWARERIAELKQGNISAIISNLRLRRPKRAAAQDFIDELIGYLDKNRSRVNYARYPSQGLTVGSGTIERGIKNVVNQRKKGCGMRWAVDRAENMLNLRAAHLSEVGPAAKVLAALPNLSKHRDESDIFRVPERQVPPYCRDSGQKHDTFRVPDAQVPQRCRKIVLHGPTTQVALSPLKRLRCGRGRYVLQ
jgi:hypothetical protein